MLIKGLIKLLRFIVRIAEKQVFPPMSAVSFIQILLKILYMCKSNPYANIHRHPQQPSGIYFGEVPRYHRFIPLSIDGQMPCLLHRALTVQTDN